MNNFGLKFHHIGMAAADPEAALSYLKAMGYKAGAPVHDPEQNANLIYCDGGGAAPDIEIVFPSGNGAPGPVDFILIDARKTPYYHLCYEAENIEAAVESIRKSGFKIMAASPVKPAILFGHRNVQFFLVNSFGLIEIVESRGDKS